MAIVGVYWLSLLANQSDVTDTATVKCSGATIIVTHLKQCIIFLVSSGQSSSFLYSPIFFCDSFAGGYDDAYFYMYHVPVLDGVCCGINATDERSMAPVHRRNKDGRIFGA